jgi:UDP-N-acetylglucosamine 1-carboxyvinyltransferase
MSSIEVIGGEQLKGEIKIQGSKNAALPVIAATILNKGITILKNCPKILDVFHMIKILEELGCKTSWDGNTLMVDRRNPLVRCEARFFILVLCLGDFTR